MSLPFWQDKCWGRVLHCFANPQASVSYLEVIERNQCSIHYHQQRANTFVVISGAIVVQVWTENKIDSISTRTFLKKGDSYTVPSGKLHRFKVIESGQVVEVYFPDVEGGVVDIDDIVRLNVGGPIE